jgi:hypothetical protein
MSPRHAPRSAFCTNSLGTAPEPMRSSARHIFCSALTCRRGGAAARGAHTVISRRRLEAGASSTGLLGLSAERIETSVATEWKTMQLKKGMRLQARMVSWGFGSSAVHASASLSALYVQIEFCTRWTEGERVSERVSE